MWTSFQPAICALASMSIVLVAIVSHADIVKGPYTLDDNAFVDELLDTGGLVSPFGAASVSTAILDTSLVTAANLSSADAFIDLAFTDNLAVNGVGADIVIFERFSRTSFDVTIEIGEVTQAVIGGTVFTADGVNTNATEIDLSDFGYQAGEAVSTLRISYVQSSAVISGVAALNSVQGIDVDIDIKPGSYPNAIHSLAKGIIPVAILGSDSFDVADVDVTTLAFGPHAAPPIHPSGGHLSDVNGDAFMDLLSHYRTEESGIAVGDTQACVTGETLAAVPIEGCDSIETVVPCGNGFAVAFVLPPLLWRYERRRHKRK